MATEICLSQQHSCSFDRLVGTTQQSERMVGDLQGIAGKAMPEIPGLDMPLLEVSTDPKAKVA